MLRLCYTAVLIPITVALHAQLSLTGIGIPHTIDFDSDRPGVNNNNYTGTGFSPNPASGQLDSDAWAVAGLAEGDAPFGNNQCCDGYGRGTVTGGSMTNAGLYSVVGNNISGHAFGMKPALGSLNPGSLTLRMVNNTGVAISSMDVSYSIPFLNNSEKAYRISLAWSLSPYVGYTALPAFDFTTPANPQNNNYQEQVRAGNVNGFSIAPGASFYLRWTGAAVNSGTGWDEVALDLMQFIPCDCSCGSSATDADADGIPDCLDNCPNVNGQIGSMCNDGNANTANDVLSATCVCTGTPLTNGGCPPRLIVQNDTAVCAGSTIMLTAAEVSGGSIAALPPALQNGLVAFYPLNGSANNIGGSAALNGTVHGAVPVTDRFEQPNSAYGFNGYDQYIDGVCSGYPTTTRTVSLWFYAADIGGGPSGRGLFGYGGGVCGTSFDGLIDNADPPGPNTYEVQGACQTDAVRYNYGPVHPNWRWVHWVITTSPSATSIYLDGALVQTGAAPSQTTFVNNKNFVFGAVVSANGIGPHSDGNVSWFNGKLDDIGIWNRALSASEVQQLYNLGGTQYIWSTGGTTSSITVNPTQTTTYTLTATSGNTACTGSTTITVLPSATYYRDADGDGFGSAANDTILCGNAPPGFVTNALDCNDANAAIYVGAVCSDGQPCTLFDQYTANCTCTGTGADSDGDGTCDAVDGCPMDANKIAPGVCGCGVADTDSDADGIPNCNDPCPNGPNPGASCNDNNACTINDVINTVCVCTGTFNNADTDSDGIPNCSDPCPNGPNPGASCNDNDQCTVNDIISANCVCVGTTAVSQLTTTAAPIISCGATNVVINGGVLWAISVPGANRYQFQFTRPGYSRNIAVPTRDLILSNWVTLPLQCGKVYDVKVRVSFDNGTTWCGFGPSCVITTNACPPGAGRSMTEPPTDAGFSIWPNPNDLHELHVRLNGHSSSTDPALFQLTNAFGELVMNVPLTSVEGQTDWNIPLDRSIVAGCYIVMIRQGELRHTERFVVTE